MAVFSAVRNRRSQKLREGFEDFMARCVESSEQKNEVDLDFVLEMMKKNDVKIEEKEMKKIEKLANKKRKITRFLKYQS